MKNVVMILFFLGGFVLNQSQAQSCKPCPVGSCASACKAPASSTASAQVMPVMFDVFAASASQTPACSPQTPACSPQAMASCSPQAMAACQEGKKMASQDGKACTPTCSALSLTPACHPAAATVAPTAEAAIDQKFHQTPKPQKS